MEPLLTSICVYSDSLHFFRSWLADPLRVASVTPSSRSLARLITREIGTCHAPVLELGPGTGVFTRELIERGLREEDLVLVENSPEFASVLRQRFPAATVLAIDAARLADRLPQTPSGIGATVSGLRQPLSVHLRTALPDPPAGSRSARPARPAPGRNDPQLSSRFGLPDQPAPAIEPGPGIRDPWLSAKRKRSP